jgi:DNA (cytosine-5)-methyltransferase 1
VIYYNEWEPYCAAWLHNLIDAGYLPVGCVDSRDIRSLTPEDVRGAETAHFFAGIGGWPYALQLAGWPTTLPVWTASCPCQPFSQAGQRRGADDERHLWPVLFRLIAECRPAICVGEQVGGAAGRAWLAGVFTDLESVGYAVAGADLCAAGVGAPHIRQRLFWVAQTREPGLSGRAEPSAREECATAQRSGDAGGMADTGYPQRGAWHQPCAVAGSDSLRQKGQESAAQPGELRTTRGLVQPHGPGWQPGQPPATPTGYGHSAQPASRPGFWDDYTLLHCLDGKARRIEPGVAPLASGVPARMGKLRAYGNSIVPQVAAAFLGAILSLVEPH